MSDSDLDETVPVGWQTQVKNDNRVVYKNQRTGVCSDRHPFSNALHFLSPMPNSWTITLSPEGTRLFTNERTGARSFVDPRLSLPFKRHLNAPTRSHRKFDGFSNVSDVLDDCNVSGKCIIILGGTGAIGAQLTFRLVVRGALVIVLSRSQPNGVWEYFPTKTPRPNACLWAAVDLTDLEAVSTFCKTFNSMGKSIDSLILCAASLPEDNAEVTSDGYNRTLQVNFIAQALLVRMLYHRVVQSQQSTIVFVSCEGHRASRIKVAEDIDEVLQSKINSRLLLYADTKFLQIAFASALRRHNCRTRQKNVDVFVCNPGNLLWGSRMISSASWTHWWWLKVLRLLAYPLAKPLEYATATIAYCAFHMNASPSEGMFYFCDCLPVLPADEVSNAAIVQLLWDRVNNIMQGRFGLSEWA